MKSLSLQLTEKLEAEYEDYCKTVLTYSPQDIFDRHYETTVKYELLCEIKAHEDYFDFLPTAIQANLLSLDNLLDTLYAKWLKHDSSIGSFVSEIIQDTLRYTSFFSTAEE